MSFMYSLAGAAVFAATIILPHPVAVRQQPNVPASDDTKNLQPKSKVGDSMELFEDRSVVLIGRIVKKGDQLFLRVKGLDDLVTQGARGKERDSQPPQTASGSERQANEPASAQGKRRTGKPRKVGPDDEVALLKSSMMEDIEEDVGLKHVDKQDADVSPMIQVQGILTMYKDQPHIFVQAYRTRTEKDETRPGDRAGEKKKD